MAVPAAPADLSGGFMVIQYTNGTDTHTQRVHVLPFSTSRFIIGGGTPSVTSDDGNHDYAYQPDRPAGQEAGITDTFTAWVNVIKTLYRSNWTFTLQALYQIQSGQAVEVFPIPNATPIVGTSAAGSSVSGQTRAMELIYNMRTALGNRMRVILIGQDNQAGLAVPSTVSGTAGGNSWDRSIVAYLTGAATAVVGHDNQKPQGSAHVTTAINRRLRRHYGFA